MSLKLFRAANSIYGNTVLEDQIFITGETPSSGPMSEFLGPVAAALQTRPVIKTLSKPFMLLIAPLQGAGAFRGSVPVTATMSPLSPLSRARGMSPLCSGAGVPMGSFPGITTLLSGFPPKSSSLKGQTVSAFCLLSPRSLGQSLTHGKG